MYYGRNSGGTHVFTAVTRNGEDVLSLDEDFYPLFEYILKQAHDHSDTPGDLPKDPYLGVVEFGTETWLSEGNVTFTAANFDMKLNEENVRNRTNTTSISPDDSDDIEGGDSSSGNSTSDEDDENAAALVSTSFLGFVVPIALVVAAVLN